MSGSIIIGIDHGYAAMKTVHFSFPTGLVEYEHEPYTQKDVLEYNGRYYVVGSGRQRQRCPGGGSDSSVSQRKEGFCAGPVTVQYQT